MLYSWPTKRIFGTASKKYVHIVKYYCLTSLSPSKSRRQTHILHLFDHYLHVLLLKILPVHHSNPRTSAHTPANSTCSFTKPTKVNARVITMADNQGPDGEKRKLVIAIDFGTTFSGVAWALSTDPDKVTYMNTWPKETGDHMVSGKVPTHLRRLGAGRSHWGFLIPDDAPSDEVFRFFKLCVPLGHAPLIKRPSS